MGLKRYLVWSTRALDLTDPWQRRWWIQQVLVHGRAEDIAALNWEEVRQLLPELTLPSHVRRLWEDYFAYASQNASQMARWLKPRARADEVSLRRLSSLRRQA